MGSSSPSSHYRTGYLLPNTEQHSQPQRIMTPCNQVQKGLSIITNQACSSNKYATKCELQYLMNGILTPPF